MKDAAKELIESYLQALRDHLAAAPAEQREEICAEIEGHIQAELGYRASDPAAVGEVLARLGDPLEIAGAVGAVGTTAQRGLEITAILLLTLGSLVLPVLGWAAGAVLLWLSRRFTLIDKVVGTLVVPGGLGGLIIGSALLLAIGRTAGQAPTWNELLLIVSSVLVLAGTIYTPVRLIRRVARM